MTLRRIQIAVVALVLFTLFLASSRAQPVVGDRSVSKSVTVKHSAASAKADWTFEGCWTRFSAGPCRDVFRDQQGNFWICRDCGTTTNPNPGKCSQISQGTLALGFWCS